MFQRFLLRYAVLLFLSICTYQQQSVIEDTPKPTVFMQQLHDNNYTFLLNQDITVDYQNYYGQFEGVVLERDTPIGGDLVGDYYGNKALYKYSKLCWIDDADFDFTNLQSFYAEDDEQQFMNYAVNQHDRHIYIITKDNQMLVSKFDSNLTIDQKAESRGQLPGLILGKGIMHYHHGQKQLYLINERGCFLVHVKSKEVEAAIVAGYQESGMPKHIHWYERYLVVNTLNSVKIYKIDKKEEFSLFQEVTRFRDAKLAIADAQVVGTTLWILDEGFGLYEYTLSGSKFIEKQSYAIRYGKKLMFTIESHCIQVTFELNKETFVAQLYWKANELHLNRFYDQISGVRQVIMINELLLVLGETETMAIWHSVNQAKLLEMSWQNKKFINGYGVINLHQLDMFSDQKNIVLAVFSVDGFQFLTLQRNSTTVRCSLKAANQSSQAQILGQHSIIIQFNSTFCQANGKSLQVGGFCQTTHSLNFKVERATERRISLVISIGLLVVSFIAAMILIVLSHNYRRNKRDELQKMRDLLRRRQEEYQRTRNPNSELA